jgi:hypothetical protein
MDGGRKAEDDVDGVGESLLVFWISRAGRVKGAAVVALLNLAGHGGTVGIAATKQQFPRTKPARIKVGKNTARPVVRSGIGFLIRNQHAAGVSPHTRGAERGGENQPERPVKGAAFTHAI